MGISRTIQWSPECEQRSLTGLKSPKKSSKTCPPSVRASIFPRFTPSLRSDSIGNLRASPVDDFQIRVIQVASGEADSPLTREYGSSLWRDKSGQQWLLPTGLDKSLDDLADGPSGQQDGQSTTEWTRQRQLWWGRMRRKLTPFDVDLDSYLAGEDALVVERLTVHLEPDDDGAVQLQVSAVVDPDS